MPGKQCTIKPLDQTSSVLIQKLDDLCLGVADFEYCEAKVLYGGGKVASRLGPSELFGLVVDGLDLVADRAFQLAGRAVHAAADLFFGQVGEELLELVEPRRRGGREVDMPSGGWASLQRIAGIRRVA